MESAEEEHGDFYKRKIRYLELPSKDVEPSADFHGRVFNWNIRKRGNGEVGR